MLTSATRGEALTPNPNECNSTLTSGTNNPYSYIDVNDRGHRFRSGSPLTNYPHATAHLKEIYSVIKWCCESPVTRSFYFMICQSSLSSTVISFVHKDKWWFDKSMSVIFCMENT